MRASKSSEVFYFLAKESWFFLPRISTVIHIILVNKNEKPGNRILPPCSSWRGSLLSHYLPKLPSQNICLLINCLHISHPFVLSFYSERSYFCFPDFCLHLFSLSNCRGDSFILAVKYSPPKNISRGKKMFGVHGSTEIFPPTSLSTASFHPALCSGEATQVTTPICFPPSPTELQMLWHITDTHSALLPTFLFFPNPMTLPHCNLLHLTVYLPFLSSMHLHLLKISVSGKASDFFPDTFDTIMSSSSYSSWCISLGLQGCRQHGNISFPALWSVLSTFTSFFCIACPHACKWKTQEVIPNCPGECSFHFQPCIWLK